MANAANHVTLSSGQILFADPSRSWDPSNLPKLPSTSLSLTVGGTIATRNISTLTFSNAIYYENFQQSIKSQLTKSLVINASGNVSYQDPKVSFVSTILSTFNAPVNSWISPVIGGAGISSNPADTLTNAIAKLDSWIGCNLLAQPPTVSVVEKEQTAFYGGLRWHNFNVYNLFQYTIPYTTSINMILGDVTTQNYLALQFTNSNWFPDRQFQDGLASDFNPIVRLRIFNSFFPTTGNNVWSKAYMQTQCVRILEESGTFTLPTNGKVFSLDTYESGENYTTVNLYLPSVVSGSNIPVRITCLNKTQTTPNIVTTSTIIQTYGPPSAASTIRQTLSTPTSFTLQVTPPIYSDVNGGISSCYFSTYNVNYTAQQLRQVRTEDIGYRYGFVLPTPSGTLSNSYLSSYLASTFTTITPVAGGYQDITIFGSSNAPVIPGIQWSTTISVTNSARYVGSTVSAVASTISAFPLPNTQNISSASISITNPWAVATSNGGCAYLNYNNGWTIGDPLSTNLLFLSSVQLTNYTVNGDVMLSDPSFPGCRAYSLVPAFATSNMSLTSVLKETTGVEQSISLSIANFLNGNTDYYLNSSFGARTGSNYISSILTDTQSTLSFQNFFYKATVTGAQNISTISLSAQSLQVRLLNYRVNDFTTPIASGGITTQTFSTNYVFQTEGISTFTSSFIRYTSTVSNLVQISGLYTPTKTSALNFDLYSRNFIGHFANFSSIGMGRLYFNSNPAGPTHKYTSSVRIYNGPLEITQLPFPGNSTLHLSSCLVNITSNIYQDPSGPANFEIYASATPANPISRHAFSTFSIGSTIFVDTVSDTLFSTFTNINNSSGQRVISLLPRLDSPGTVNNMDDGVTVSGLTSNGINTVVSSFFIVSTNNYLTVSSSVIYNNTSSISTYYLSSYSRELIFTNGAFMHPAGLDFTQFNGAPLGVPAAQYPDFTNDLQADTNYGNRYASFLFYAQSNVEPTGYQFVNIRVRNPSAISTITNSRTYNYAFPDTPIPNSNIQYSKVRMHMKIIGAANNGVYTPFESAWINCLKEINYNTFDDDIYDVGGCTSVSTSGADVYYKVQIERRYYTSVYSLIRVGISRDGSAANLPPNQDYLPITFEGINVTVTDS